MLEVTTWRSRLPWPWPPADTGFKPAHPPPAGGCRLASKVQERFSASATCAASQLRSCITDAAVNGQHPPSSNTRQETERNQKTSGPSRCGWAALQPGNAATPAPTAAAPRLDGGAAQTAFLVQGKTPSSWATTDQPLMYNYTSSTARYRPPPPWASCACSPRRRRSSARPPPPPRSQTQGGTTCRPRPGAESWGGTAGCSTEGSKCCERH
jgi:hypothetical protein